jgi:hypothetical protein
MFNNSDSPDVKWRPILKKYTNPSKNVEMEVEDGDPKKPIEATSYNWWVFFRKVGRKYIFNDGYYSSQTNSHQEGVKNVLKKLRIKYVTIRSKEHLGKPDEVLFDLIKTRNECQRRYEFTLSNRCQRTKWGQTVGKQRKYALKCLNEAKASITGFLSVFDYTKVKVLSVERLVEKEYEHEQERAKQNRQENAARSKEIREAKKQLLDASWITTEALKKYKPQYTNVFKIKAADYEDEQVTKVMHAFLNSDEIRKRYGNYYIDGDKLFYRMASVKHGTNVELIEYLVAQKFQQDDRTVFFGNKGDMRYIGSRMVFGYRSRGYGENEIQRRLSEHVTMLDFKQFKDKDMRNLKLADFVILRLTGGNKSEE